MALITQILFWGVLLAILQLRPANSYGNYPGPYFPGFGNPAVPNSLRAWPPRPPLSGPEYYEKSRTVHNSKAHYPNPSQPSYFPEPFPKHFKSRARSHKTRKYAPRCAAEGNKCDEYHTCCDDMKCTGSKGQGENCDLALAFDSEECKGRTCKRNEQYSPPPKCIEEGNECDDEQKCCEDMRCTGGKEKGDDCDLALAFDSEECKNKKRTCEKDEQFSPPPKCIEEGNECDDEQKCCEDMKCTGGKEKGENCDLALAFDSEECKNKKRTCQKNEPQPRKPRKLRPAYSYGDWQPDMPQYPPNHFYQPY